MREQISALVVEVKEMYKRQVCRSNSFTLSANLSLLLLPLRVTAVMKSIFVLYVFTAIYPGLAKRSKPVLPARPPATSLDTSDTACPSDSLVDVEVRKTKAMLGTETLFRPCDCGGPGWEKIAFYDFSQQECPPNFTRVYGQFNSVSCETTNRDRTVCHGRPLTYFSSSLPLPVQGRSYSNVCGRVRGHGRGLAFHNAIVCNYSLEQAYVDGVSLTHGPAGRRTHIWTFAAAVANGHPNTRGNCGCSNTNKNRTHATPGDVGDDYFCDSNRQYTEGGGYEVPDEDDDLWDGEGCGSSSSCCEWKDPPYFCKHLYNTTSEDMEIRLFSLYYSTTVSLIEIFAK